MEQKRFSERLELKKRDPKYKDQDKAALQAIAQAAVNVELFTIPLYMVSMYSIQGMHQITSKGNDFYRGRLWPGSAPSPDPLSSNNAHAFNLLFSVFIDEMLHLQLAANIAKVLGVTPSFTSPALMNSNYGWTCYGPGKTVIPQILDFRDTRYPNMQVQLGALTEEQNRLFLAIEENDEDAKSIIVKGKYFPPVPFENFDGNLPMFGTIGWMYKCLWEYLEIEYTDGTTLFDSVFHGDALERDLFNADNDHHHPEYPKMTTMASAGMSAILDMINAITDQGEGKGVAEWIRQSRGLLRYAPVEDQFRPDQNAMNFDYPHYTDTGKLQNPSGSTAARIGGGGLDHHDRFVAIGKLLPHVTTWEQWHRAGNTWTADMLETTGSSDNHHPIPTAKEVATALNTLKSESGMYDTFSQIATGAIAGITRVLDDFWEKEQTAFPSPSMYGSGDRVSICWAIFGKVPDLSKGIVVRKPGILYHACQGLSITSPGEHTCAPIAIAHSCKGSNTCKAEGGCGFVQLMGEIYDCSHKALKEHLQPLPAGAYDPNLIRYYYAPSDNPGPGSGGCAVPISASQMFPPPDSEMPEKGGTMVLYDVVAESVPNFGTLDYEVGELVYDVAWKAYIEVLTNRHVAQLPSKPPTSIIRLALPPST